MVTAYTKWVLPQNEDQMKQLHRQFRSATKLAETSLVPYTTECLKYASQMMESETHYSGGMSQLSEDFQDQLENGQYVLEMKTEYVVDSVSNVKEKLTTRYPRVSAAGATVRNKSDVQQFGIVLLSANIGEVDYAPEIDDKLKKKIEQSTTESISKQTLITAKQEALTAIELGKKSIEETRAKEEALKTQAVIIAQKERAVAEENVKRDIAIAASSLALKKAEAEGDKLKVLAGLSPLERANIDKATAIGVAEALAGPDGIRFPEMLIIGGGANGGSPMNPFDAVGLESFIEISKKISKK